MVQWGGRAFSINRLNVYFAVLYTWVGKLLYLVNLTDSNFIFSTSFCLVRPSPLSVSLSLSFLFSTNRAKLILHVANNVISSSIPYAQSMAIGDSRVNHVAQKIKIYVLFFLFFSFLCRIKSNFIGTVRLIR